MPDMNPMENAWAMLSKIVYENKQYNNQKELWKSIQNAAQVLSTDESH